MLVLSPVVGPVERTLGEGGRRLGHAHLGRLAASTNAFTFIGILAPGDASTPEVTSTPHGSAPWTTAAADIAGVQAPGYDQLLTLGQVARQRPVEDLPGAGVGRVEQDGVRAVLARPAPPAGRPPETPL